VWYKYNYNLRKASCVTTIWCSVYFLFLNVLQCKMYSRFGPPIFVTIIRKKVLWAPSKMAKLYKNKIKDNVNKISNKCHVSHSFVSYPFLSWRKRWQSQWRTVLRVNFTLPSRFSSYNIWKGMYLSCWKFLAGLEVSVVHMTVMLFCMRCSDGFLIPVIFISSKYIKLALTDLKTN